MKPFRVYLCLLLVSIWTFSSCKTVPLIKKRPQSITVKLLDPFNKIKKSKTLDAKEIETFLEVFNECKKIDQSQVIKEKFKEGSYDILIVTEKRSYSYLFMNSQNVYRYQNNEFYLNKSLYKLIKSYFD